MADEPSHDGGGLCGALPGAVYPTIGSLDEPNALPPTSHAVTSERIAWLHLDEDPTQFAEGPDA